MTPAERMQRQREDEAERFDLARQLRIREANKRFGDRMQREREARERALITFLMMLAACFIFPGFCILAAYLL